MFHIRKSAVHSIRECWSAPPSLSHQPQAPQKNKVQSVPYLNAAHWHEGQTNTEHEHPCFLHLEFRSSRSLWPSPPSCPSFYTCRPSITRTLIRKGKKRNAPTVLQSSITANREVKWPNLTCKLELQHEKKAHAKVCQRYMVFFLQLGLHLVFFFLLNTFLFSPRYYSAPMNERGGERPTL